MTDDIIALEQAFAAGFAYAREDAKPCWTEWLAARTGQPHDTAPSLTYRLAAVTEELATLRANLEATIDDVPESLRADDRRASSHWFAMWKEGNRKRAELLLELERLRGTSAASDVAIRTGAKARR